MTSLIVHRHPSKPKNVTGPRIREARLWHNPPLSQAELAACVTKCGVNLYQGDISRIEHRTRNLSDYELVAIARCLKVPVAWLCGQERR